MNGKERRKTEQSTSLSSTDHWQDKEEEGRRRGMVQGEGSSRGHEALEASAKEPVMSRLPQEKHEAQQERKGEEEEGESGMRRVVKKLDPRQPSKEEIEKHEKAHLPFRNWCRHCVRGQGKEEPCRRGGKNQDPDVPEIHMDFMFMGEEGGSRTLAMLVVKERSTKAVMACVTPAKSSGEFLGKRVLAFMREFGCELEAVTVKTERASTIVGGRHSG